MRSPRPGSSGRSWWTTAATPCCPLSEAISIGILEATVHLLDLQRALGVPPEVPPAGLEHTVGLLAEMTPPVGFVELATGRSEVEVFPVLR